ncbi:condensation domain-containing protein [Nocardia suismassiliense]|uniref:condensation domain-containing protein n=1 Tax=Nocardia suismassiliense TaxID=2077092 RepID=UPI00131F0CA8|nr:condensation domain-containing protein [Nocardia suismassiliense]
MNSPASSLALARLRERRAAGISTTTVPLREGAGPFPVTPAQRGIWLHEQLAGHAAIYHVPLGIRITGPLDVAALHAAADAVTHQQHAFRTVFKETSEGLRAEVVEATGADWQTPDLRLVPAKARAAAVDQLLESLAVAPFDLAARPPVRWALIRLAEQEWILAVVAHHLVLDGLSIALLIDQLWAAYGAARHDAASILPVPPRQYADYAVWSAEHGAPATQAAAVERRAALLRGAPPLDLSIGRRPRRVGNTGARVETSFPRQVTEAVRASAAAHGVPPFVFLLACYELTLAQRTGQRDFCIGIPMAARPYAELAKTIGHFVNTVPVRADLTTGQTFRELLHRTRDTAMAAYDDETVPFEQIVEAIGGPWDPAYSPVFQTLFVQQVLERPDLSEWGLTVEWHTIDTGATLYDLVMHVAETGSELVCHLTYNAKLLDATAAADLAQDFLTLAAAAATAPETPVDDLLAALPVREYTMNDEAAESDSADSAEVVFEAPIGERETRLAALWAQALERTDIGRHDDFFLLGGTSLAATRVISQILDEFGVSISLRELFESPTIVTAARLIETASAEQDSLSPLQAAPRTDGELLAVSYAQERLWFLETLDPGNATYIMPGGLRLRGELDVAAVEKALALVEQRHEVLRSVYRTTEDGQLRQVVRPYSPRPLEFTDLSTLPPEQRGDAEAELAASVYRAPFDLAEGPVWRYHLIKSAPNEYLLAIALHHIVCDGWSVAVLSQEVSAHYRAEVAGVAAPLPPLVVQYADYAAWQRGNADRLDGQLEFWRTELADPTVTEIPGDRPRPARRTSRGAVERLAVDPQVMAEVRALAARSGVTTFAVLLAAFYTMLNRYTRQQDLIVASPIAGRTRSAVEPLVGCFLNTLALRTEIDPEETFTALVARVGKTVLSAHANQDLPFEKVIEAMVPTRDMSRTPLAQVMFNYLNTPPPSLDMAGLDVELVDAPRTTAKMDFDLTVDETDGPTKLTLEYSADLYDAPTAVRALRHYATALASIVAEPDQRVGEIGLADPDEVVAEAVWALPGTAMVPEAAPDELLIDRLDTVIDLRGSAPALRAGERSTSFAELDAITAVIAKKLIGAGLDGSRVALLYDHTPESFVAVWAALRAGVAYVPLDPRAPQARLIEIIEEADVSALLCDPSLAELGRSIAGGAHVFPVSGRAEPDPAVSTILTNDLSTWAKSHISADDLAYILHTSGSTGRPKGVAQSRGNALAHAVTYARRLRIGPDDVVAAPARYTFDAGVLNSFGAAVAGAELYVIDPHLFSPAGLREEIERAGVTVLHCTPTLFRYLLSDTDGPWVPAELRLVALGGEEVVRGDVVDFGKHFTPACRLVSLYGPSECSVALQHIISPEDADRAGVPIGHPVEGVEVELVDGSGRPTEVYGEIALRSSHVAIGYWHRPELTEKVFGTGPNGIPFYRTGDLARRLPDGTLVFVGRKDRQVKIRGHRVEPGEAETFLRSHSTVGEAAVVLDTEADVPRLVAYLTQDGPLEPDYLELSAFLRTRLPDYMIPSAYMVLDNLPRGLTGKLDRAKLPKIAPAAAPVFTPPGTELERIVAEVWAQVLDREVGLGQNFFDLGGHSLALARVRGLLERRLGVELAMTDLFAAPTVDGLAKSLAGRTAPQDDTDRGQDRRAAAARRRAHRQATETRPDSVGSQR